eukprot:TRINITY_DN24950_c0_g1_i10.p1 TRINITY_DN24950_c0_g1~~TRINITY_DN24950_c0_g1_i10.p1  ORF type:complete len:832 (+),score=233.01 TRINITY_DN24950_c0_g1_i10:96-2591(+)
MALAQPRLVVALFAALFAPADALQKQHSDWSWRWRSAPAPPAPEAQTFIANQPAEKREPLLASQEVQQAILASDAAAAAVSQELEKLEASVQEAARHHDAAARMKTQQFEKELLESNASNEQLENLTLHVREQIEALRKHKAGLFLTATALNQTNMKLLGELESLWRNLSYAQEFLDRALKASTAKEIREAPELRILAGYAQKERSASDLALVAEAFGQEAAAELSAPTATLHSAAAAVASATEGVADDTETVSQSIAAMVQVGSAVAGPSAVKAAKDLEAKLALDADHRRSLLVDLDAKHQEELNASYARHDELVKEQHALHIAWTAEHELNGRLQAAVEHLEGTHQELLEERSALLDFLQRLGALPTAASVDESPALLTPKNASASEQAGSAHPKSLNKTAEWEEHQGSAKMTTNESKEHNASQLSAEKATEQSEKHNASQLSAKEATEQSEKHNASQLSAEKATEQSEKHNASQLSAEKATEQSEKHNASQLSAAKKKSNTHNASQESAAKMAKKHAQVFRPGMTDPENKSEKVKPVADESLSHAVTDEKTSRVAMAKLKVLELEKWANETAASVARNFATVLGEAQHQANKTGNKIVAIASESRSRWSNALATLRDSLARAKAVAVARGTATRKRAKDAAGQFASSWRIFPKEEQKYQMKQKYETQQETEATDKMETKPKAAAKLMAEAKPKSKAKQKNQTKQKNETKQDNETEAKAEAKNKNQTKPKAKAKPKNQTKENNAPKPKPKAKQKKQTKQKNETKQDNETEAKAEKQDNETEAKAEAKNKNQTKPKAKAKPKNQTKENNKTQLKTETKHKHKKKPHKSKA